jgi:hypothetical protein
MALLAPKIKEKACKFHRKGTAKECKLDLLTTHKICMNKEVKKIMLRIFQTRFQSIKYLIKAVLMQLFEIELVKASWGTLLEANLEHLLLLL